MWLGPTNPRIQQGGFFDIIVDFVEGHKAGRMSKAMKSLADDITPAVKNMGETAKSWAQKDWDTYKTEYQPVAQKMAQQVSMAPDVAGAEGKAATAIAHQRAQAQAGLAKMQPTSGTFRAASNTLASQGARAEAAGLTEARIGEENKNLGQKIAVAKMVKPSSGQATLGGIELMATSGKQYGKYSDKMAGQAGKSFGSAARGITGRWGEWNKNQNTQAGAGGAQFAAGATNNSGVDYSAGSGTDEWSGYADGGIIDGPGTGTSDSIPAEIDGAHPARVSDGEYHIPPEVVQAIGADKLEALRQKYHDFGR